MKHSFQKSERLKSKKQIDALLKNGAFKTYFPLKVYISKINAEGSNVRFLVAVPKKKFPSAVDRNRVKRIIRECWRKNKAVLCGIAKEKNFSINVGVIYLSRDLPNFFETCLRFEKIITYLVAETTKTE
ncbi:MAG: ribonuclease P protein component [Bacteroidota bacterium]